MQTKILYIITKSNWGGGQRYVYDLATNLDPEKFDVTVVLGSPHPGEQASGTLLRKLKEGGIKTIEVPEMQRDISFGKEWRVFWKLFTIIRKEKPRVVHVNSSKAGGLGALAARIFSALRIKDKGLKIIFTVHGWPFMESTPGRSKLLMRIFSWLTAIFSDEVIVISKENLEVGSRMPFIKNKLTLIYNGIQSPDLLLREEAREKLRSHVEKITGISPDKQSIWIGTIAEYIPNKALPYLLAAMIRLMEDRRDLKIFGFLIGDGEERKKLEDIIESEKVLNKIFLTGFIPNASEILPAFDIFTLPSVKEGHPYTLIEAGFAGLPVVATRIPGITDIVGDAGILVEPKNVTELSHALLDLATHEEKRAGLGLALKEKVTREFSFQKMLSETTKLYR